MSFNKTLLLAALVTALGACSKVEPPAENAQPAAEQPAAATQAPVSVAAWGPQITTPGAVANPLPNGNTGMYFTLSRPVEEGQEVQVMFDGQPLPGVVVDGTTVTAELPASNFAALGQHAVTMKVGTAEPITVGQFVIAESLPPAEEAAPAAGAAPAADAAAAGTAPAAEAPAAETPAQ